MAVRSQSLTVDLSLNRASFAYMLFFRDGYLQIRRFQYFSCSIFLLLSFIFFKANVFAYFIFSLLFIGLILFWSCKFIPIFKADRDFLLTDKLLLTFYSHVGRIILVKLRWMLDNNLSIIFLLIFDGWIDIIAILIGRRPEMRFLLLIYGWPFRIVEDRFSSFLFSSVSHWNFLNLCEDITLIDRCPLG